MPLSVGDRLGPYEILAPIGKGGMGEVYRARDSRLNRDVAIKVSAAQFSERFEREARAIAALNHPNICHLYDVGPNYLVMEYVEGTAVRFTENTHKLLDQAGQIAEGIASAHHAGIVHRDLKPGNILITRDGRVKILDFGLALMTRDINTADKDATLTAAITDPGTTVGTVAYMSPEQARGETADARSDLWSLGVILYEMSTGSRPFEGPTTAVVFQALLGKTPVSVRERNPKVPLELERIVNRLLEKDRDMRYQSAADVRADLKRVERDSGSTVVTEAGPSKTSRVKYWIAATSVLLFTAGGSLYWRGARTAPLSDKDVLVLADFTNTTGDQVFDGTLREALAIQLEQSPFLKIMGDEQMRQNLRLMNNPSGRITNEIAHDICVREGEKATIGGAIASLGKTYTITLQAANCRTGDTLAREQVEAEDKEHVLRAIATAARAVRGKLGESLSSIQKRSAPAEQVTTSSLEAFQAFTLGREQINLGQWVAAAPYDKHAIELDPNFALAWYDLGVALSQAGAPASVYRPNYQKAYELSDRVSEGERLNILAMYYSSVTGEAEKSIATLELWARTYPREYLPHHMLGNRRMQAGELEQAAAEYREAIRLEPHAAVSMGNLIRLYLTLDRLDEAKALADQALAHGVNVSPIHLSLLQIAYTQGDSRAAEKEIQWLSGKLPEEYFSMQLQASDALMKGQRRRAEKLQHRSDDLARRQGFDQFTRFGLASVFAAEMGDCAGSLKKDSPPGVVVLCRDVNAAQEAIEKLPSNSVPEYWRAVINLHSNKGAEATAGFQKILDHRVANWGLEYALSYVGLARPSVLTGDVSKARKAYQDFFAIWKEADPDIPILIAARKEYAALQ